MKTKFRVAFFFHFSLIEIILWWYWHLPIVAYTGFMQNRVQQGISLGILMFWTTLVKYSLNVSAILVPELRITLFSTSVIFYLTFILSKKTVLTYIQSLSIIDCTFWIYIWEIFLSLSQEGFVLEGSKRLHDES